ncbi:glutamine amidotransferase [Lactococcus hircilactis]|uniref:Lipid II isoglutaminyl synthase (glutamine-hydrolyzing) subunit GatD n=1 Tax=Lactococcus hircilactis TaxID=1494462 RepID=A0A7X2CZY8_9LACT|nr:lipid II isoglutaminyl synthase subunit GatD [Lactococcus hircilactis]MQW39144.1 glutamine amidotransferase [Lactococcus hircilactis]
MTYTSLQSTLKNPAYALRVAHLFGDLMNTYGDNGNILMLKYVGEKLGVQMTFDIVSLGDSFKSDDYNLVFWGGGQDYEQGIISEHLNLLDELRDYIEAGKPMLAICGGYQMLGQSYILADGTAIPCTGILGHKTENPGNDRIIGDVEIYNETFDETYYGFENHGGRTTLSDDEKPLGKVIYGGGNNGVSGEEGLIYKNTFGSYFHGPLLSRNARLAYRLVTLALKQKYGNEIELPLFETILGKEASGQSITDAKRKA